MNSRTLFFIFVSIFVFSFLFILGCANTQDNANTNANIAANGNTDSSTNSKVADNSNTQASGAKTYSPADVAMHSSETDCWMVLSGKIYNFTEAVSRHPGGKAILQGCGKDATELFETRPMGSGTPHSENARSNHDTYYLGELGTG